MKSKYAPLSINDEMDTLAARDAKLEQLWDDLTDVPLDPVTECIEEAFYCWPAGTDRLDIWHWFDDRYSKGIAALLYKIEEGCEYGTR